MAFTDIFKVNSARKKKKAVDTKGVVLIGENGSYFKDLDNAYLNSPTATMALLKFHEYCVPADLADAYQSMWKRVENDYIRYGYFCLYVPYTIDADVNMESVEYRPASDYRIKEQDDTGKASIIINIKTGAEFPVFNSDKSVVKAQFLKEGYAKFKGQIYMYNDSSLPYRLTPLYSVLNWMQTEGNAGTFVSKTCDNAMFGNNIFVIKKSSDASAKELEIIESVREAISGVKGVEESAQNLLLEYEGDIEDVTKLLSKVSISNDANVDLMNSVDEKAEQKICTACYGFPRILISQSEGIFSQSGEAIQVATDLWAKTCRREAQNILDGFREVGLNILNTVPNGSTNTPDNSPA